MTKAVFGRYVVLLFVLLMTQTAVAYQLTSQLGMATGYSNNVDWSSEKESDAFLEMFTELRYQDQSGATEGDVQGRLGYRKYINGNASDELNPNLLGKFRFHLRPDRIYWLVEGDWQQRRINDLGPDSPDNLENQAVFQTGPDLRIPLTASTEFVSSFRGGYLYNSDEQDAYRFATQFSLVTKRSQSDSISTSLGARAIRYREEDTDSDPENDFNIVDAFLTYATERSRANTVVDIGVSHVEVDDGEGASDMLFRLDASARLTELTRAGLRVNYGLDDQGTASLSRSSVPTIEKPMEAQAEGSYRAKEAELYYEKTGRRSMFAGAIYVRDREDVDDQSDERHLGLSLAVSRRFTRQDQGRLYGVVERAEFNGVSAEYTDYIAGCEISRRLTRDLQTTANIYHRQRSSDVQGVGYDGFEFIVSLVYQISP